MKLLTYLQARNLIKGDLSEHKIQKVLTISGRASEWIERIANLIAERDTTSDLDVVEQSGMGREILQAVPREEWVYLVNPSLACETSKVVTQGIVNDRQIFSTPLLNWLLAQEIGVTYRLSQIPWTHDEAKVINLLWDNQEKIVDREMIAGAVWGESWSEKYSDWGIDALMHRIRAKVMGNWQLITIKGRGYMLVGTGNVSNAPNIAMKREKMVTEIPGSIYPSDEYLSYMNDQKRVRKVYRDLFRAVEKDKLQIQNSKLQTVLCVNSYSYDNVDSVVVWAPNAKIYFVHYDPRAIEMHQERIKELGVGSKVESIYDDMRESKMRDTTFDLVINDFRLNFNQDDKQNKDVLRHTMRVLNPGGVALFSTVVDGRYENLRYGLDQEKAPINAKKPGTFQADEHLVRRCWSVPYYRQLFEKAGFSDVREFDIEDGKRWGSQVTLSVNPWQGPYYRRWWMRK